MMDSYMSLDDVLDAWMLEDPQPSYAALVKWCKRYPQYRDELTEYFSTWSRQRLLAHLPDPVLVDQEKLVARTVEYALKLAEEQGLILPDDAPVESVSLFDQLVLAAIYGLRGRGLQREHHR
jgi:hypothetical protein